MKNYLIISLLFLSLGFSQKEYHYNHIIEMNNGLWTEKFSEKPITGRVYIKFGEKDNLKKVYFGNLLNGKKDGRWTIWFDNGRRSSEGTYKDGKEDGLFTEWYENGKKEIEITIKDGEIDGLMTQWYKNGQKLSERTYKNGKEDGLYTQWFENGQKEYEKTFKNGEIDGLETTWSENGKKKTEVTFKNGEINGLWTEWFENGQKETEGTYKDGIKKGLWTSWVITDDEFGCFIGLKIQSNDILNDKVLKTIKEIKDTIDNSIPFSLYSSSIIDEVFYQNEDGLLFIEDMFPDLNRLKLTEIEKQEIIEHIQQRESLRNVFLSLENNYTTVLINTNEILPKEIEIIKKTVEQYETDNIEIDVYVPSKIQLEGDMKSPDVLRSIEEIKQFLMNNYNVEYSLSFSDYIKDLHYTVMDYDPDYKVIPESRDKIQNLLTMYSMSGDPEDFSYFVDYDYSKSNILFYLPDKSELEKSKMVWELKKFIDELTLIKNSYIITYPKYEYF